MSISKSGGLDWLYNRKQRPHVKIVFSDAGYGHWTDVAWKYFKSRIDKHYTEFILLTRKWDRPHRNTKRWLKRFRNVPSNIIHKVFNRKTTHAGIGDQALEWAYYLEESGCGEGERK